MKHLLFRFVFSVLAISLVSAFMLVWDFGITVESLIAVVFILGTPVFWIYFVRHLLSIDQKLRAIEKGEQIKTESTGEGFFALWDGLLLSISGRIAKQEREIQREKISRLRSVIDGQDQERNRLSRELHDGIGQSLIAVKLQLENAETMQYSLMRAGIDAAKDMIDLTIEDIRRVCNALLPVALDEFGIVSTLRALCTDFASLAGFKAVFDSQGSLERLDKKSQIYLYRIAQESLNNVVKHARATSVSMILRREGNLVTLEVTDNGKGFTFDPVCFAKRNGLQNMRERVHLLFGEFSVSSQPGEGTTIKVCIPYNTGDGKNQTDVGG